VLKASRDSGGAHYEIPADKDQPAVEAWWQRRPTKIKNNRLQTEELFCIRQDNSSPNNPRADVLVLSPGQVYDLLAALNSAVENW
jgi:hypothetical protein